MRIWDHPFKTSANFQDFWPLPSTPSVGSFFTTIRLQIWPIFDPSPPKKCRRKGGRGQKSWKFADVLNGWSLWGMLGAKKNCVVRRHSEIDGKKHGFRYFSLIIKCCHYCYYYTRLLSLPSGSRILLHQGQCLSIKVNYFHIVWFDKKIPSSSKAGKKRWNYFSVQNKYKCPAKKNICHLDLAPRTISVNKDPLFS